MTVNESFLHAIHFERGRAVPVPELFAGSSSDVLAEVISYGLESIAVFARPLADSIRDCTRRSLETAGLTGSDIDAVVLMTESFHLMFGGESTTFRDLRTQTFNLFRELGIRAATVFCATFGGCTNLLQGALVASSTARPNRHVLLVAAERFASAEVRLMPEAASVAADGVATCIVSALAPSAGSAFRLDFVSLAPYRNIVPGMELPRRIVEVFRAVKNAAADCYEGLKTGPEDFRWMILGDYNRKTTLTFGRLAGFPAERMFLENVGRFGHVPFDPLINLSSLVQLQMVDRREAVLLLLMGPLSCGAIAATLW